MGAATQDKPRTFYTIERDMIRTEKTAVEIPIAVTKIAYRLVERTPKAAVCVTLTNVGTVDQLPNEYPIVEDWKTCMHSAAMKQTGLAGHLHKPANQNARGLKENLLYMLDPRKLDQVKNEEVPCPEDPPKWLDIQ
jgi:histidyl-tRNA synthetase